MPPKPPAPEKIPKKAENNSKIKKKPTMKGKSKGNKRKSFKIKLGGWLKTPADWARFNAWVKINAQPRKIPEPPPLTRSSRPLWKMKKRIEILSKPSPKPEPNFRNDLSVSKKALKAKPSKRIKILAKFVPKYIDPGREFPIKVPKSALNYKPSPRIHIIAKPKDFRSDECKELQEKWETIRENNNDKKMVLRLAKRALKCPGLLTDNDLRILMTETGVYRSALNYKPTPWMTFLALPSYKFLKDRKDEKSKKLKDEYLEDLRKRGKRALAEKTRKLEAQMLKEANENQKSDDKKSEDIDEGKEDEKNVEEMTEIKEEENVEESDDEESKAKWMKRNAWRFAPPPWKEYDPLVIKKSALKGPVSPRMAELAKPSRKHDKKRQKDPFKVKKSALTGPIPGGVNKLAKPSRPRDPIKKPPPRERNAFNQPIYPKPKYGRKMPRVEPYKEKECGENKVTEESQNKSTEEKLIDPIAFKPSIDPYFDPYLAKRQLEARKIAREIFEKEKISKNTKKTVNNEKIENQIVDET